MRRDTLRLDINHKAYLKTIALIFDVDPEVLLRSPSYLFKLSRLMIPLMMH